MKALSARKTEKSKGVESSDQSSLTQNSCIYEGTLRHRRFTPVENNFSYPIFMLYLDLDELEEVINSRWFCSFNKINIASFFAKDYFGFQSENELDGQTSGSKSNPGGELKQRVIEAVCEDARLFEKPIPVIESVCLLTHLRYANLIFNPVSFYYCYDGAQNLVAILAEITNTPWGERHSYVLHIGQSTERTKYQVRSNSVHTFEFDKDFHVSPFNPMNMLYEWSFADPGQRLNVHMNNLLHGASQEESKHFDATLVADQKPIAELGKTLIRYPFMCVSVVVGIYWQALKLWVKRSPFYSHPKYEVANELSDLEQTTQNLSPKRGVGQ